MVPLAFAFAVGWFLKPWMAGILTVLAILSVWGVYAAIAKGAESSLETEVRKRYAAALENAHPAPAPDWKDDVTREMPENTVWYVGLGLMILPWVGPKVLVAMWCGVGLRLLLSPRKKSEESGAA